MRREPGSVRQRWPDQDGRPRRLATSAMAVPQAARVDAVANEARHQIGPGSTEKSTTSASAPMRTQGSGRCSHPLGRSQLKAGKGDSRRRPQPPDNGIRNDPTGCRSGSRATDRRSASSCVSRETPATHRQRDPAHRLATNHQTAQGLPPLASVHVSRETRQERLQTRVPDTVHPCRPRPHGAPRLNAGREVRVRSRQRD